MFGFFGHGPMGGGQFEAQYRCYPVTFIDKAEAERGDKVFLPPSALDRLAQLHIDYPMLFQVENRRDDRRTHCGVLEFVADEGMIYMPYWMMQNLLLTEGDIVSLRSATLSKGSFVKLQPHSSDFLDISNPRAVLETTLRNFSCLTVGDTIPIHYNNKSYFIDIIEAKPANAISVIETDCNVDFAPPLDYKEPERRPVGFAVEGGAGPEPMDAQPSGSSAAKAAATAAAGKGKGDTTEGDAAAEAPGPTFLAFSGSGMRLDGKPISNSQPVAIPMSGTRPSNNNTRRNNSQPPEASGSGSAPKAGSSAGRKQGKLMFKDRLAAKFNDGKGAGSGAAAARKPKVEEKKKEEEKEEDPKFKAFQGKSFSLK